MADELHMISSLDQLSDWCAVVPNLKRTGENAWESAGGADISYPADGLTQLADVEPESYWFAHRNAVIAAVVERFPPTGPIFDIGGGNGFVSLGLTRAGFPCVVVEPDKSGIASVRRRGLPSIMAAFEDLHIPSNSIPAAGLFDVIEHIEDEATTLAHLHEVLQPGGMAYIAVPAYNFLWSAEDVHAGHFRRYTVARLRRAMQAAGFEPLFGTSIFAILVPAVFARRTLPSLFSLRRGGSGVGAGEHHLPASALGRSVAGLLDGELRRIRAGRAVPIGTSCFVVARKRGGLRQ